jgi:hypothetical protein
MTSLASLLDWESTEKALVSALVHHPQREALLLLTADQALILVRNWYGKLMLLLPCSKDALERSQCGSLMDALKEEAGLLALPSWVLCRDELFDADAYWNDPALLPLTHGETRETSPAFLLLERQDKERDWLTPPEKSGAPRFAKRCVFFSVKGGVGRSAALMMLAITLAKRGKRVLVIDGDFESPGVSSSLLPVGDEQPEYGVVDWLTAQALGADRETLDRMALAQVVAPSPLNARLDLPGQVLVAPAYGRQTEAYVSKLARVYRQSSVGKSYAARLNDFLSTTEAQHQIDITLFDCRAGIDETAAAAITQLQADISFLFAINTRQTWDAYKLLFRHLQRNLALFPTRSKANDDAEDEWDLRRSFRLVSALSPQAHGPYVGYYDDLMQKAYDTFSTIYNDDPAGDALMYSPGPDDSEAPHAASRILWVDALRAFDPLKEPHQLTDPLNQAAFADFLGRATTLLGLDDEHNH